MSKQKLFSWIKNERGATMIEYGLLTALLGAGLIVSVKSVRSDTCETFAMATCAAQCHTTAGQPACTLRGPTMTAHCRDHVAAGHSHGTVFECNN